MPIVESISTSLAPSALLPTNLVHKYHLRPSPKASEAFGFMTQLEWYTAKGKNLLVASLGFPFSPENHIYRIRIKLITNNLLLCRFRHLPSCWLPTSQKRDSRTVVVY